MKMDELKTLSEQRSQVILQSTTNQQIEECILEIMNAQRRLSEALRNAYYIKGVHKYSLWCR